MSDQDVTLPPPESGPGDLSELLALKRARNAGEYRKMALLSAAGDGPHEGDLSTADQAELRALLAEYVTLRQESMNTINNRIQIMVFGLAAAGALATGALAIPALRGSPIVVVGVFSYAIPLVYIYIVLTWLSEAIRAARVGYYIASSSEARINAKLGRLVLTWEAALWTGLLPRDELGGPSMLALGTLGVVSALSPLLGLTVNGTDVSLTGRPLVLELWIPFAILLAFVWYCKRLLPRLRNNLVISSALHLSAEPGGAGAAQPSQPKDDVPAS
jgi:hypothetical protein